VSIARSPSTYFIRSKSAERLDSVAVANVSNVYASGPEDVPINSLDDLYTYYSTYLGHGQDIDVIKHGQAAMRRMKQQWSRENLPRCLLRGNAAKLDDNHVIRAEFNMVEKCDISYNSASWWYEANFLVFRRVSVHDGHVSATAADGAGVGGTPSAEAIAAAELSLAQTIAHKKNVTVQQRYTPPAIPAYAAQGSGGSNLQFEPALRQCVSLASDSSGGYEWVRAG